MQYMNIIILIINIFLLTFGIMCISLNYQILDNDMLILSLSVIFVLTLELIIMSCIKINKNIGKSWYFLYGILCLLKLGIIIWLPICGQKILEYNNVVEVYFLILFIVDVLVFITVAIIMFMEYYYENEEMIPLINQNIQCINM